MQKVARNTKSCKKIAEQLVETSSMVALFQLEIQKRGTKAHYNGFISKAVFHSGVSENIICFSGGRNILLQ